MSRALTVVITVPQIGDRRGGGDDRRAVGRAPHRRRQAVGGARGADVGPVEPLVGIALAVERRRGRRPRRYRSPRRGSARPTGPRARLSGSRSTTLCSPMSRLSAIDLPVSSNRRMRVPVSRARLSTSRSRRSLSAADASAWAISRASRLACADAAVDDPAAVRIEVEEAARQQREREDIDRQDARRERNPSGPSERAVRAPHLV